MPDVRLDRTGSTYTFRSGAMAAWQQAVLGVIGAGGLGGLLAVAAARSGARVLVIDPQNGARENLGTQLVEVGRPKARTVAAVCNDLRPGAAEAIVGDILHVGPGRLRGLDVLCDCTDDGALALRLTELSNGLGVPLLRLAVDGSGAREMGRVRCSSGGAGQACQLCGHDVDDLVRVMPRTPCPGAEPLPPPTLAGEALNMTISGFALLQAQRLVTGNDLEQVQNREILIDWTGLELLAGRLRRSDACLSGHLRWNLIDTPLPASEATFGQLFRFCRDTLRLPDPVTLSPLGHPLYQEASCACGPTRTRAGTRFASLPVCERCGERRQWRGEAALHSVREVDARALDLLERPLAELGLPKDGALIVARTPGQAPAHLLLANTPPARRSP